MPSPQKDGNQGQRLGLRLFLGLEESQKLFTMGMGKGRESGAGLGDEAVAGP